MAYVLLLAGCSTTQTLEWKGGKVLMSEERRFGGLPHIWELRVVSGKSEMDALRKKGWKVADGSAMLSINWQRVDGTALKYVIHQDGGADTYLMKRPVLIQSAAPVAAAPPPFHPKLITNLGITPDGSWRIGASETNLDLTDSQGSSIGWGLGSSHEWETQPGWFVFIETESRVWAYNGDRDHMLMLTAEWSRGNGASGSTYWERGFPCTVPIEVFSRLAKPAQEAIRKDE
jgi:hypothetical protein